MFKFGKNKDKQPPISEVRSHLRLKFLSALCQWEYSQYNGVRVDKDMAKKADEFVISMKKYISIVEKRLKLKDVTEDEFLEHVEKLYEILNKLFHLDTKQLEQINNELEDKFKEQINQNGN